MKKNLFVLIPGLLLTMVLTSCGCGGKTPTGGTIVPTSTPTPTSSQPATPTPSKVAVTAVVLDKSSAELEIGEKLTLVATVAPKNATNKNVTWSSNNANVATVENGVVTAKSNGQAVITVKTEDGGKTATCTVTVKKAAQPTPTPTPSQPVTPTPSQPTVPVTPTPTEPTVPVTPTPTPTPEPTSYAHYVMVGETKMWLVEQPADPGNPDMLRQFTTLQNFDVTAGTQFSFFNEGGAWEVHAETEYGTGKLTGNLNEELVVRESAEGVALWLHEYEGGYVDAWLGGYTGGGVTPTPTGETGWYLKGTMNEWAASEQYALSLKDEDLPEGTAHQYYISLALEAAAEFKFNLGETWLGYDSLEDAGAKTNFSKNVEEGDSNNNIIVDVAGTYDFYLKELSAGGYQIYVGSHGGEPTPIPTPTTVETVWHLKGTMNEWAAAEEYALEAKDEDLPEGTAHQYFINVELEAAAEFKFALNNIWLGYDDLENAGAFTNFSRNNEEGDGNNNIIVDVAGSYDFYLKELSAGGYSIYVGTHGGEPIPTPTTPTEHVYKVLVGETEYTLEERDPDPDNESMIKQYTLSENIDVVASTQFSFLMDGEAWTVHAEVQYGTETLTGNLNADLQVRESAEGVALWLHEYEGGYVDAWLGGYTGGGEPTPTPTVQQCKYSLLVGETAYDTTHNDSALDPSYDEYMALNIAVEAGDEIQVRDNESAGTPIWTIQILNPSSVGFEMSGEKMVCTTSGTYDFYLKFKYGADEVYIGLHS